MSRGGLHEMYGDRLGAAYLVDLDGLRGPSQLAEASPDPFDDRAKRLTAQTLVG